jgi:hypothetical protein
LEEEQFRERIGERIVGRWWGECNQIIIIIIIKKISHICNKLPVTS